MIDKEKACREKHGKRYGHFRRSLMLLPFSHQDQNECHGQSLYITV
jgi:hypothetical protein